MKTGTAKQEFSGAEVAQLLSGVNTKEWNEAISTRLEDASAFLSQDVWVKGIDLYLRAVQGNAVAKILNEQVPPEGVHYLRGFAAALRIVLNLPRSIESQLNAPEKKGIPPGSAGY